MNENRCETCGNDSIILFKVKVNAGRFPFKFDTGIKEMSICKKCVDVLIEKES